MKEFKKRKEQRMLPVTDDWHPCYEGGLVSLTIQQFFYKYYECIISVWGADDTGMEMRYSSAYPEMVDFIYNIWKEFIFDRVPDHVNMEWFYEHGFYPA